MKTNVLILTLIFILCKTITIFATNETDDATSTTADPVIIQQNQVDTESSELTDFAASSSGLKQLTKHHDNNVNVACSIFQGTSGCSPGEYSSNGCTGCQFCPVGNNNNIIIPFSCSNQFENLLI